MSKRKKQKSSGWQVADDEEQVNRGKVLKERLGDGVFVWATVFKPLLPQKGQTVSASISQSMISLGEMIVEVLQRPLPRVILAALFLQLAWWLLR